MGMVLKKVETPEQDENKIETCKEIKLSPLCMKRRMSVGERETEAKVAKKGDRRRIDANTCAKCSKKLKTFNTYQCRCGSNFCGGHRFEDQHDCKFDYKAAARKELTEKNPKIAPR